MNTQDELNDNIDRPERHNINPANRPPRNDDPMSPRNHKEEVKVPQIFGFEDDVNELLGELQEMLISKNKKYGNSALDPKRIFSKASPIEQIKVRIDDKLSRIANGSGELSDEDTVTDLIGYLVLLKIAQRNYNA